jgi:hypothetical protein
MEIIHHTTQTRLCFGYLLDKSFGPETADGHERAEEEG